MSNVLCSREFDEFYNKLLERDYSVKEIREVIKIAMPLLAKQIKLAKLEAGMVAEPTIYEPKGANDRITFFETEEECSRDCYELEFVTGEKGVVTFRAYLLVGCLWTDEVRGEVEFLIKNIFYTYQRARLMEMVRMAAITDKMTYLPNSEGLFGIMNDLFEADKLSQYTAMFLDVKNFKYVNKCIGNVGGNEVLVKYSGRISHYLMPDEVIARPGGDNFVILVKSERAEEVLQFLSNITISIKIGEVKRGFDIQARIGVYEAKPGDTPSQIVEYASIALSATRKTEHNHMWFKDEMRSRMIWEKEISNVFFPALGNNEFVVYYQPKVRIKDGSLCGAEALVRWIRNGRMIPPMDFIPVIEREGTVGALDFYVLERVCRDIRGWLDRGVAPVRVSVNFSKINLRNPRLADEVIEIMDKYNVNSKYLEIELTETTGYDDYESLLKFVSQMRERGVHISIDDFGTGYSSLNLLKDLNVNVIKIDKSFMTDKITAQDSDEIVVKNIVNMVSELNMETLAEGVETKEQARFLENINCHMAQGYLYAKPMPHDEFEEWLIKSNY